MAHAKDQRARGDQGSRTGGHDRPPSRARSLLERRDEQSVRIRARTVFRAAVGFRPAEQLETAFGLEAYAQTA